MSYKFSRRSFFFFFFALLATSAGFYWRWQGANWDQGAHLHPDERFITMAAASLKIPPPGKLFWNPQESTLSPYNRGFSNYIYGEFPLLLNKFWSSWRQQDNYKQLTLNGRHWSALFSTATLIILALIAFFFYSPLTALFTLFFAAHTVILIQQAHFWTAESFLLFFISIIFLLLGFLTQRKLSTKTKIVIFFLLALNWGLALACKLSALYLAPWIALALFLEQEKYFNFRSLNIRKIIGASTNFAFLVLLTYLVFRFFNPHIFQNPHWLDLRLRPDFLQALKMQYDAQQGKFLFPPSYQWLLTRPLIFPLKNIALWALGLPLFILSLSGLILESKNLIKGKNIFSLLLISWIAFLFFYQGFSFVKAIRYFLPALIFLPLFAAISANHLFKLLSIFSRQQQIWGLLILFLFSGGIFLYALGFTSIYRRPHSRIQASQWIYQHLPAESTLAVEHWDDPLPVYSPQLQARARSYRLLTLEVYNPDNEEKIKNLQEILQQADYLIISSKRAYASIGRLPQYFPIMSKFYPLLFSGQLGWEKIAEFTSYPRWGLWELNDDNADEFFTVYDHPKVMIFAKKEEVSLPELLEDVLP